MQAKRRLRHGSRWFMCVSDGETLFLYHHVASNCDSIVHLKHPQKTQWTRGQPCLSSLWAIWPYHQAWITSLQHLGRAIAYVKSISSSLRVGNCKNSWSRCRCHSRSWHIWSSSQMVQRRCQSFPIRSWVDLPHVYEPSA